MYLRPQVADPARPAPIDRVLYVYLGGNRSQARPVAPRSFRKLSATTFRSLLFSSSSSLCRTLDPPS